MIPECAVIGSWSEDHFLNLQVFAGKEISFNTGFTILKSLFAIPLIGLLLPPSTIRIMNFNRNNIFVFALLIIATALYRVIPFDLREGWLGAPQFAMAIFAGSVIKQRRWAFALPVFSMLISDIVMQLMHYYNPGLMPGFYSGQLINYVLIASTTVIGFFISNKKPMEIGAGILAAPTVFFLLSNFIVWAGNGGWHRAKTATGLMQSYADGLPFYKMHLLGTLVWGVMLFGTYLLFTRQQKQLVAAKA